MFTLPNISYWVQQGTLLNYLHLFYAYNAIVEAGSDTIYADVQTKQLFKMLEPTMDSIEFALSGVAGSKLRTDGILKYVEKAYDMQPIVSSGVESVVNGDFSDGTNNWTEGSDSSISATSNQLTVAVTGEDNFGNAYQAISVIKGKKYLFKAKAIYATATVQVKVDRTPTSNSPLISFSSVGSHEGVFTATETGTYYVALVTNGVDSNSVFSDVSVVEYTQYPNDATQTTELSQPYQSGVIAPNEFPAMLNPNGDARYVTHPEISFAANEAWTVTTVFNWGYSPNSCIAGSYSASNTRFRIRNDGVNVIRYISADGVGTLSSYSTSSIIGKNTIVTFVAKADGTFYIYVNGVIVDSFTPLTNRTSMSSDVILQARNEIFNGSISSHTIRRQALTAAQVLAEANLLQTIYPDIPTVKIGTQEWATSNFRAVATPMGNIIANVTDNTIWASSQTLYDDTYAATVGTAAEKEQAALEAAAMWCYYNNDSEIGSWAGKKYNGFAKELIKLDIATQADWGYHVPTEAEWDALNTAIAGDTDKLKEDSDKYWDAPNTGNNETGFTSLAGGYRDIDGSFVELNETAVYWTADGTEDKRIGASLRLIKD